MAQLLHLPDLAAARPPAGRRRGVALAAAPAGPGRVKQGEAGTARGWVIRVADPVREGRMPVPPPPPLLAAPATPSESPPATGRRGDEDDEERQRYYLNMGYAIRTLREELPDVLYKEPSFDIYRDDIVFQDPLNTFKGLENYKRLFWALRFTGWIFFKALWVDIVSIWQPAENMIMIRWIAHGIPRVPWDGHGRFDGASVYKLDKNGKIYEHKVHNVAMNPPTKFKALLAARSSGAVIFLGTFGALAVMTVISVVLGRAFHYVDGIIPFGFGGTDFPVDDIAAACLLVYYGVTTLLDAASGDDEKINEEQEEAELAVSEFSGNGAGVMSAAGTIASTFVLVFVAEWGDKSFFSTIALAAASSPLGVVAGSLAGHAVATLIAVLGGSLLGTFLSEKIIAYNGGGLFLALAAITIVEIVI